MLVVVEVEQERVAQQERVVRVLLVVDLVVRFLVVDFERLHQWFSVIRSTWFVRQVEAFDTSLRGWHKRLDPRNSFQNE